MTALQLLEAIGGLLGVSGAVAAVIAGYRTRNYETALTAQRETIDAQEKRITLIEREASEERSGCAENIARLEGQLATVRSEVVNRMTDDIVAGVIKGVRNG